MATIEVQPRETPAERADAPMEVEVDETFSDHATIIEDWIEARQSWTFTLREGHDGIAKLARLTVFGLDVALFHILTFT
jgi:hypothetical protein